jgi:hypothetical protein
MMKSKVHVLPQDGKWKLSRSPGAQTVIGIYDTKSEAISAALKAPQLGELIIHTATGQIFREPDVKTTGDKNVMRQAVLNAVKRSEKRN